MSSLKDRLKNPKSLGAGAMSPILKMTEIKGSEFLGKFIAYKHVDKEFGTGKKKEMRGFDIFEFEAVEATGVTVTPGESYSIFASGHLRHLLADVMENPATYVGKQFLITYVGTEKMTKGAFKNKDAHKFAVTLDE